MDDVLTDIQNLGYEIILVSFGAIVIGANKLNFHKYPETLKIKWLAQLSLHNKNTFEIIFLIVKLS